MFHGLFDMIVICFHMLKIASDCISYLIFKENPPSNLQMYVKFTEISGGLIIILANVKFTEISRDLIIILANVNFTETSRGLI